VLDQVNVDEHPALADLGAGYFAGASLFLQGHRVNVQECGSGLQIERVHANAMGVCCEKNLSTQVNCRDLLTTVTHLAADRLPRLEVDFLLLRRELL
jgi:hypothetical protein